MVKKKPRLKSLLIFEFCFRTKNFPAPTTEMSQRTQREKPKVPEFVHEHVLTNEGEMTVRTYARGKFLGKV